MRVPMGAPRSLFLIENWKHRGTMGHPYFETSPQRNGNTTSALNLPVPPQHSSPPLFPEPGALSVQRPWDIISFILLPNAWPCPRISACSGHLFPLQPDSAKSTWPAIRCKIPFGSIGLWYLQFVGFLWCFFCTWKPYLSLSAISAITFKEPGTIRPGQVQLRPYQATSMTNGTFSG